MHSLWVTSGLERGMVRSSRANLRLRNLLSRRAAWLHELFDDPQLPHLSLLPGGAAVDFRWRLLLCAGGQTMLQLALPQALLQSLGFAALPREGLLQALAMQCVAPLMPALRRFFGQDVSLRVEEAPHGWPEADHWCKFQLSIPSLDQPLPGRMTDATALRLSRMLAQRAERQPGDVPLIAFVGASLQVPVSAALRLRVGDVLVCHDMPAGLVRLHLASASARQQGRCIAVVRRDDGCVEHVVPGTWFEAAGAAGMGAPRVRLDVVQARLLLSSQRCREMVPGHRLEEWPSAAWPEEAELRLGGCGLGSARPIQVAGREGFEILRLNPLQ